MKLLDLLFEYTRRWAFVFAQDRSLERALALAFGILCGVGKRTITRAISFQGNAQKDWSADYKVFSRSPWEPRALFHPILEQAIQQHKLSRVVVSIDDTRVWRNGKHVPRGASCQPTGAEGGWPYSTGRAPNSMASRSDGTAFPDQFALGSPLCSSQFGLATVSKRHGEFLALHTRPFRDGPRR